MLLTALILLLVAVLIAVPMAYLNIGVLLLLKPVLDKIRGWLRDTAEPNVTPRVPRTGRA